MLNTELAEYEVRDRVEELGRRYGRAGQNWRAAGARDLLLELQLPELASLLAASYGEGVLSVLHEVADGS